MNGSTTYVCHDADDGAWQFHPQSGPTEEKDASIVALETICKLDPGILELADLPFGWCAWREKQSAEWQRAPIA